MCHNNNKYVLLLLRLRRKSNIAHGRVSSHTFYHDICSALLNIFLPLFFLQKSILIMVNCFLSDERSKKIKGDALGQSKNIYSDATCVAHWSRDVSEPGKKIACILRTFEMPWIIIIINDELGTNFCFWAKWICALTAVMQAGGHLTSKKNTFIFCIKKKTSLLAAFQLCPLFGLSCVSWCERIKYNVTRRTRNKKMSIWYTQYYTIFFNKPARLLKTGERSITSCLPPDMISKAHEIYFSIRIQRHKKSTEKN